MKKIIYLVLLILCMSCGAKTETALYYYENTNFQKTKIDSVETYIKSISKDWEFRVFEKDRKSMKALTNNEDAFFIGLYKSDQHILTITNVGIGSTLRMSVYGDNDLPKESLKKLGDEVGQGLLDLGIKMVEKSNK